MKCQIWLAWAVACRYYVTLQSMLFSTLQSLLESLSKPRRRRRRRQRHQTKRILSKTMAVHARYKSFSSVKQPREITKFSVLGGTRTTTDKLELNAVTGYLVRGCFQRVIGVLNRCRQLRISLVKYKFIFDQTSSSASPSSLFMFSVVLFAYIDLHCMCGFGKKTVEVLNLRAVVTFSQVIAKN